VVEADHVEAVRRLEARHAGRPREPAGGPRAPSLSDGAYTLYTIYASSDPESIGSGITSGCVGLLSQDMIHLYSRTPIKTKVVVLPA
jgi:lipoprotein-anchoring transpeptidase ErfK/SrfK